MRVDTGRLRVVAGEALEPIEAADGTPPTPGAYLREHRLRRNMSLHELADATKIPRTSLELIEQDRIDELPGLVFAKGFLRCCARTLELDEDTLLGLLYEQEREQERSKPRGSTGPAPIVRAASVPPSSTTPNKTPAPPSAARVPFELRIPAWFDALRDRLTAPRVLLWILVTLFVILVVFLAFTIASGQGAAPSRT